jgi:mannose-6-phosphate isomerase-like protein (cupin superfamily)
MPEWETMSIPAEKSYTSPGGSAEIRMLPNFPTGEITHAAVPPDDTSKPAYLSGLTEFFFGLFGRGEVWRSNGEVEEVVDFFPNRCLMIPEGVRFQYQTRESSLVFLVIVAPRWSADRWHEAPQGLWDVGDGRSSRRVESLDVGPPWATVDLPSEPDHRARDGTEVRNLLSVDAGAVMSRTLDSGQVSYPVFHQTADEIWYVLDGTGDVWRSDGIEAETTHVEAGTCLTIPAETRFQSRATGESPLQTLVGVFPWSSDGPEAPGAEGIWEATS